MVFINNIITALGKIVEAFLVLVFILPIILIVFTITYAYNTLINLIK
jgi:hypothetical protein